MFETKKTKRDLGRQPFEYADHDSCENNGDSAQVASRERRLGWMKGSRYPRAGG